MNIPLKALCNNNDDNFYEKQGYYSITTLCIFVVFSKSKSSILFFINF